MKRLCAVASSWALVACSVVLAIAFAVEATTWAGNSNHDSSKLPRTLPVSDDDEEKNFHWANGTITNWDPASKTFVLRTEEGAGKKKRVVNETFAWNEKTTVEGSETKVGQRAKVKYTKKKKGGTMLAHHVFIGKRAIRSHKEEKSPN